MAKYFVSVPMINPMALMDPAVTDLDALKIKVFKVAQWVVIYESNDHMHVLERAADLAKVHFPYQLSCSTTLTDWELKRWQKATDRMIAEAEAYWQMTQDVARATHNGDKQDA